MMVVYYSVHTVLCVLRVRSACTAAAHRRLGELVMRTGPVHSTTAASPPLVRAWNVSETAPWWLLLPTPPRRGNFRILSVPERRNSHAHEDLPLPLRVPGFLYAVRVCSVVAARRPVANLRRYSTTMYARGPRSCLCLHRSILRLSPFAVPTTAVHAALNGVMMGAHPGRRLTAGLPRPPLPALAEKQYMRKSR
ncbi:hypothetical protein BDU57DRAFT_282756 [Ampelomyces quisqualis]|uniref:Uncharacterized protein n=1 Tax=Ampelomyces quisqualis TaxID=50730 RepID=A0A6A5QI07_AMPQU|nr:hypothetical protein BDU57DRAFT_282756 [Ampelomyces quisqualis]